MTSEEMFKEAYKLRRKEKCERLHAWMKNMMKDLSDSDFTYDEAFNIAKCAFMNKIEDLGREYLE